MTVQQTINTEDAMNRYGLESPRAQEMLEAARAMGYRLINLVNSHAITWPDLQMGENCKML